MLQANFGIVLSYWYHSVTRSLWKNPAPLRSMSQNSINSIGQKRSLAPFPPATSVIGTYLHLTGALWRVRNLRHLIPVSSPEASACSGRGDAINISGFL